VKMHSKSPKVQKRLRKKKALRDKLTGTPEIPRLVVYRSNRHMYAQLVDDVNNKVLMGGSDLEEAVKTDLKDDTTKTDMSTLVGKVLAAKALEQGIKQVIFDRNGFKYHGRVKALADAVREAGVEI